VRHRTTGIVTIGLGVLLTAALVVPSSASALPLGNQLVVVSATTSIITGNQWQVVGEVDDLLANPVPGTTVWTGIQEPSTGCGSDLTASACTALATDTNTTDASGRVTLTKTAQRDTFVLLYLADSTGALDPTAGRSVLIRPHNSYPWSGPSSVTLNQYAIGNTPHMIVPGDPKSPATMATGAGTATTVLTQVSTDGGTHWTTVGRGVTGGVFPITTGGAPAVDRVNLMASKPGTYSVRVTDNGGQYEDPGVSPVVTITVTKRGAPQWLRRTNQFRSSLGLAPVADNPVYDAALAKHAAWMNKHNILSHSEPPGSAGYSKAGNEAAGASVLSGGRLTEAGAVDGWMGAPFHASCLLNAYWAVGGYGSQKTWSGEWCQSSMQTLDLATGANGPVRSTLRENYTFPSSAMKVPLTIGLNGNEAPDPVAGCGGTGVGPDWSVPVIFRVAHPPSGDRGLRHASATLRTKSGRRLTHTCLLTGTTYRGPDVGTTQIGRLILGNHTSGRWAMLLSKAGSISAGHTYTATLTDGGLTQQTTFTLARS
jgi:uncharacterized protein YkwD